MLILPSTRSSQVSLLDTCLRSMSSVLDRHTATTPSRTAQFSTLSRLSEAMQISQALHSTLEVSDCQLNSSKSSTTCSLSLPEVKYLALKLLEATVYSLNRAALTLPWVCGTTTSESNLRAHLITTISEFLLRLLLSIMRMAPAASWSST